MTRAADADVKIHILKRSPLFSAASDDDLAEIARVSRLLAVTRGGRLARAGEDGAAIYVLQSGVAAELVAEAGGDGAVLTSLVGPGGVAGLVGAIAKSIGSGASSAESAIDPGREKSATSPLEALSNISSLAVPAADFLRICRRNADLALALAGALARAHEGLSRVYAQSRRHSLETRLAAFFAQLASLIAKDDWNPVVNVGRLSQSAIATMLGVSREHINRTLAIWERSGLIFQNGKGDILIQNARRLQNFAVAHADGNAAEKQDEWLWEIDAYLDRGLNQSALHLALESAKRAPKDLRYMHRAVLATARLGAISEALALIDKHKLGRDLSDEELACLKPRLLRDLAFFLDPTKPDRLRLEISAADYEKVFAKTGGFYPGVNAAAGYALIGEQAKSQSIARSVGALLAKHARDGADEDSDNYWRRTTLAECKLLEGDRAAAATLFEAAWDAGDATPGKKATTRKQLKRLGPSVGVDKTWVDRVAPQPNVLFFSGPLARREDEAKAIPVDSLLASLDDLLSKRPIGWAYGALASGADIIIAEALIAAGVGVNVYLPVAPAEFLKSSVQIGGQGWRERFIACIRAAASIEWNRRAMTPCNAAYRLGAEIAMGKALRHAAELEAEAVGFFAAPLEGEAASSLSLANLERWKARGLAYVESRGPWPSRANGAPAADSAGESLLFAFVLQNSGGGRLSKSLAASADYCLHDAGAAIDLLLYSSLEKAISEAAPFSQSAAAAAWQCWLDAGVFAATTLEKGAAEASAELITSACKPMTDAGKIFASEPFACAAPLVPSVAATFEYVGFVPTREKVDPCALYLVQF